MSEKKKDSNTTEDKLDQILEAQGKIQESLEEQQKRLDKLEAKDSSKSKEDPEENKGANKPSRLSINDLVSSIQAPITAHLSEKLDERDTDMLEVLKEINENLKGIKVGASDSSPGDEDTPTFMDRLKNYGERLGQKASVDIAAKWIPDDLKKSENPQIDDIMNVIGAVKRDANEKGGATEDHEKTLSLLGSIKRNMLEQSNNAVNTNF